MEQRRKKEIAKKHFLLVSRYKMSQSHSSLIIHEFVYEKPAIRQMNKEVFALFRAFTKILCVPTIFKWTGVCFY